MDRHVICCYDVTPVEIIDNRFIVAGTVTLFTVHKLVRVRAQTKFHRILHTELHTFPIKLLDWSDYQEIYSPRWYSGRSSR